MIIELSHITVRCQYLLQFYVFEDVSIMWFNIWQGHHHWVINPSGLNNALHKLLNTKGTYEPTSLRSNVDHCLKRSNGKLSRGCDHFATGPT